MARGFLGSRNAKWNVSVLLKPCPCLFLTHTDSESFNLCVKSDPWYPFPWIFSAHKGERVLPPPYLSLSLALCRGTGAPCAQCSNPIIKQSCVTRLPWQNQWKQYSRIPLYTHYWRKDRRSYFKGKCQSQQPTQGFKIELELIVKNDSDREVSPLASC